MKDDCVKYSYLSGVCALGTKSCVMKHTGVVERDNRIAELEAKNERLRELIKLMQSAVQDYLPPVPQYADKDWLINRLIYLLDGPEQRAAMEETK